MALHFWLPCPYYSPHNNIHLSSPLLPRPPSPSFRSRNGKKWAYQLRIASVDAAAEDVPSILVAAARHHAALRAAESLRKEPLFHDPYAACVAALKESQQQAPSVELKDDGIGCYELATRFIDDSLLKGAGDVSNPVRQVVLLTDGMDTRPYRLPFPSPSLIFDVSPSSTYNIAAEQYKAVGAKVPTSCSFRHISVLLAEDGDWKDDGWAGKLVMSGYRGDRPSVWAMQGLQTLTADGLQVVLGHASSMVMKDSLFIGELPLSALGDITEEEAGRDLCRIFGGHGFDAEVIEAKTIVGELGLKSRNMVTTFLQVKERSLLFAARQLRFSDEQLMEGYTRILHREVVIDKTVSRAGGVHQEPDTAGRRGWG